MTDSRSPVTEIRPSGPIFVSHSAKDVIERPINDLNVLGRLYEKSSETSFDPLNDPRLAVCYNFLYKRENDEALKLSELKGAVDRSELSAARLVYTSWLHTLMYASEGGASTQMVQSILEAAKIEGDAILDNHQGDLLSVHNLSQEMAPEVKAMNSTVAIKVGAVQTVELLNGISFFADRPEVFKKISEGIQEIETEEKLEDT